jgi:hypothetical protein
VHNQIPERSGGNSLDSAGSEWVDCARLKVRCGRGNAALRRLVPVAKLVLVDIGFDAVSVRQMTTTRRSLPEDPKIINLPLFFVTLPNTAKSQEIFRLPSLCHIAIKVEAYRAQNGLTQCHNCQQFGHV